MWIAALFVMVLKITPAEASYLMIWVGILGIMGRVVASGMSDVFGTPLVGLPDRHGRRGRGRVILRPASSSFRSTKG
jgi:hypothetical protein